MKPNFETVWLADGEVRQALIDGVAPIPSAKRDIAALEQRRARQRGHWKMAAGGLFDETPQRSLL